jgi:hypothetical protein
VEFFVDLSIGTYGTLLLALREMDRLDGEFLWGPLSPQKIIVVY